MQRRDGELDKKFARAGFQDGALHYFQPPFVEEGEVKGYWSSSPDPVHPAIWPPSPDAPGPAWAWEYSDNDFRVEVLRYV
jgi:hypothetical protein